MTALLLEAAWRSAVLAAAVAGGLAVFRVRSPELAKIAWTTVLMGSLAMPAILQAPWTPMLPATAFAMSDSVMRLATFDAPSRWRMILAGIYTTVLLILLLRFAIGLWRMSQVKRRAVPLQEDWTQGADVRVAVPLSNPVTFGSTILLPSSCHFWSPETRSAILTHEHAHVRHRDCQVQWLATIHACLFWFSPAAWWIRRQLTMLAEHVSDDAVLRMCAHRADYAAVLLETAQTPFRARTAMSMASGNLARRIERILCNDFPLRPPAPWQRALARVLLWPAVAVAAQAAHFKNMTTQDVRGPVVDRRDINDGTVNASAINEGHVNRPHANGSTVSSGAPLEHSTLPLQPYIMTTAENLERWYPEAAQRAGLDGGVQIAVTLDQMGHATGTRILSESPPGMGFGQAAAKLAHTFKYANPTGQATTMTYRVNFELLEPAR